MTALPSGITYSGVVASDYPGQDFVAKNVAGGGIVARWHSDGTFTVVGEVNSSAQVLAVDPPVNGSQEVVYTTQGLASLMPDGSFFTPPLALPADVVAASVGRVGSGLAFLRYDPDGSHPGLGTLILANLQRDLSKQYVTVNGVNISPVAVLKPEVDTVVATGVVAPTVDIPVYSDFFNGDRIPDVIAGGYAMFGNPNGTFRVAGALDTSGFTSQTRFMKDPIGEPFTFEGNFVLAYAVAGFGGSPAAVEFRDSFDGNFKVVRTITLTGAAGDPLVAGTWTNGRASDLATAGAGGIEVFPARGDGTYLDVEHVAAAGSIPFSTALNTDDVNNPVVYMLCTQGTGQGMSLVSLPDTAGRGPITNIDSSVNPSVAGESVTLRAMVAGFADQTVSFYDGTTKLGDVLVDDNSEAMLRAANLSAGTHRISVQGTFYSYNFEFGSFTQEVVNAPPDRPYLAVTGFTVTPSVTLAGAVPINSQVRVSVTLSNLGGFDSSGVLHIAPALTTVGAFDTAQRVLEPEITLPVTVPGLDSIQVTIRPGGSITLQGDGTVPDMAPRYYVMDANVSGDAGLGLSADVGSTLVIAPMMQIAWAFGGDRPVPLVKDLGGGDVVTFSLTGGGIGLVTPNDPFATLGNGGPDFKVVLSSTTLSSSLVVTQTGTTRSNIVTLMSDGPADLGAADLTQDMPLLIQIGGAGPASRVGSLKLGTMPPDEGDGVTVVGTLGSLEMPVLNVDVSVTSNDTRTPMNVTIGTIAAGHSLVTTQPIESLNVTSAAGGSSVRAYLIGSLNCTGNFSADMTLTAPPSKLPALGTARIGGSVVGTSAAPVKWQIAGNVGRIRVAGNVSDLSMDCGVTGAGSSPAYVAANLLGIDVGGFALSSVIAAGVDPVNGVLGDGDDRVIKGGSISAIRVAGPVESTKFLAAKVAPVGTGATSTAAHLVFVSQPGDVVAGRRGAGVTVQLVDNAGNPVTTDRSVVSLSIATGSGTGTVVGRARLVNGVARFGGFGAKVVGFYSLEADAGNFEPAITGQFNVTPDKSFRLRVVNPQPVWANGSWGYVEVVDRFGNRTDDSGQILQLKTIPANNPFGASISATSTGVTPVIFQDGLAYFGLSESLFGSETGYFVSSDRRIRGVKLGKILGG